MQEAVDRCVDESAPGHALRMRMSHPALQATVRQQAVHIVPMCQRHRPAAHHRTIPRRLGPPPLRRFHSVLPRFPGSDTRKHSSGMVSYVVRPSAVPGHEALCDFIAQRLGWAERRMISRAIHWIPPTDGQHALSQGEGHLRIVGEGTGREPPCLHLPYQAIGWLARAEL